MLRGRLRVPTLVATVACASCQGEPLANETSTTSSALVAWSAVETQKLEADPGAPNTYFGGALDADGDTLVVGASGSSWNLVSEPVRVYTHGASGWSLQAALASPVSNPKKFGISVAVSGDRLVASAYDPNNGVEQGRVWVFVRTALSWSEEAELVAPIPLSPLNSSYGGAVDIDGDVAVVGSAGTPGRVFVFERSTGVWAYSATLTSGASDYSFGTLVKVRGDTVAVVASTDTFNGKTNVFRRTAPSAWALETTLTGVGGALALHDDLLFVRSAKYFGSSWYGTVTEFRRSGTTWNQGVTLAAPSVDAKAFGAALDTDGTLLAVSEPDGSGGSVHLYSHEGTSWMPVLEVVPAVVAGDEFGSRVAITTLTGESKRTLAAGVPGFDSTLVNAGAVRTFQVGPALSLGASCAVADECASGFCADGVCCDQPCSDGTPSSACRACSVATGAPTNGTCMPLAGGTVCSIANCVGTAAVNPADLCDGNGQCVVNGVEACGAGKTCVSASCVTGCSSALDCAPGETCQNGGCVTLGSLGETCSADGECVSGHCVDGVCCNQACGAGVADDCLACNATGICTALDGVSCATGLCASGVCTPIADAGTDAATDAGTDAATDAGTDAATDAGTDGDVDAGSDAGTNGVHATSSADDESCGCREVGGRGTSPAGVVMVFLGTALALRRRRKETATVSAMALSLGMLVTACGEQEATTKSTTATSSAPLTAVFEQKLTVPFAIPLCDLGTSLAADGSRLLAGAPYGLGTDGGVFEFAGDASGWTFASKLPVPVIGTNASPGLSLGLVGNLAFVGVPEYDEPGHVRVLDHSAGSWSLVQTLFAPASAPGDEFGASIAVDAQTLAIGAYQPPAIHVHSAPGWSFESTFPLPNGPSKLCLEDSTLLAVAGASAYVFEKSGGSWSLTSTLTPTPSSSTNACAISGSRIAIGRSQVGEAKIYVKTAGTWTLETTLKQPGGETNTDFGGALALDGTRLFVGAPIKNIGTFSSPGYVPNTGAGYLFELSSGTWTFAQEIQPQQLKQSDRFGDTALLSSERLFVGATHTADSGEGSGSVWVYEWKKSLGDACGAGTECASNFCIEGVCCDSSCGWGQAGDCLACTSAKGATADGTCTPLPSGTECGAGYCTSLSSMNPSDTCDANGVCVETPEVDCNTGFACSAGACSTSCQSQPASACLPGWTCVNGSCEPAVSEGEACSVSAACASGHCVDGVCCDSSCSDDTEDCLACSVAAGGAIDGVCGPANDVPCNDGNACTLEARCDVGTCKAISLRQDEGCGELDAGTDAGANDSGVGGMPNDGAVGGAGAGGAAGNGGQPSSPGSTGAEDSDGCSCALERRHSRSPVQALLLVLVGLALVTRRRWPAGLGLSLVLVGCGSATETQPRGDVSTTRQSITTAWVYDEEITVPGSPKYFGKYVAIEGDTLFVTNQSDLYRFARSNDTWQLAQKVDGISPGRMKLSGQRLAVTHPASPAHTLVFEPVGTTWNVAATLPHVGGTEPTTIAMTTDRIVIGEPFNSVKGNSAGAAWVFEKNGTAWGNPTPLDPPVIQSQGQFGSGVVATSDSILVGAWLYDGNATNSGAVFVFEKDASGWHHTQTFSDLFRMSGAMDAAGKIVAVGGYEPGYTLVTALYEKVGTTWTLKTKLAPAISNLNSFSIAMSPSFLALGHSGDSTFGYSAGAVFTFEGTPTYAPLAKLFAPVPSELTGFGSTIALSDTELAVGQSGDPTHPDGVVYLYRSFEVGGSCTLPTDCPSGFCVDGVCCDSACGGSVANDCRACSVATGATTDGKCAPIAAGSACGATCFDSATVQPAGACTTDGACSLPSAETCKLGHACVLTSCADPCTNQTDCLAGYFCSAGTCTPVLAQGLACTTGNECASHNCADGVCCDKPCGNSNTEDCIACAISAGASKDGNCEALNGTSCADGNPCTASAECVIGFCEATALVTDGTPCFTGICASGTCSSTPYDAGSDSSSTADGATDAGNVEDANTMDTGLPTDAGATADGAPAVDSTSGPEGGGCDCGLANARTRASHLALLALLTALALLRARQAPSWRQRRARVVEQCGKADPT